MLPPFDVQQPQDVVDVRVNMVKTRGDPTLLIAVERSHDQSSSAVKT